MERTTHIISDIDEAVQLIETYRLAGLVWDYEDCPLHEIKHYAPKGKEELVVVCHTGDKFMPFRLTLQDEFESVEEIESRYVELKFHDSYSIFIISKDE